VHGDQKFPVSVNLDNVSSSVSDEVRDAIYKEFSYILRLLDFNNRGYEIFRRWYVDGKGYYHMIVDPKNPKKGIIEMRPIDSAKIKKIAKVEKEVDKVTGAKKIKGVKEVINEIQIVSEKSLKITAKDLAASAQLRADLIGDQEISSLNYSIDVVNGIVYLSGVAANEKERERVIAHAQALRFAKKVVNYIILSTDKRD